MRLYYVIHETDTQDVQRLRRDTYNLHQGFMRRSRGTEKAESQKEAVDERRNIGKH